MEEFEIEFKELDQFEIEDVREVVVQEVPTFPALENLTVTPTTEEQVFNHENSYGYDEVRVEPMTITLQQKTITPTKSNQVITFDENYDGLESVSIHSIPDNFIEPTGTLEITENGEYNIKEFEKVNVNVVSGYILNVEDTTLNFSKGASVNENEVIL